ncbi:MAG TPA: histone deacetylase [Pseudobdellovibrionaceae bacterium]|nr:histone deacetylase [Pseudobdellovibrionaceae bacterium]
MLRVWYSDDFTLPLPEGHRFPMRKYRDLREALLQARLLAEHELFESPEATREELLLAHDPQYVDGILNGTISERELKPIGFPWSPALVRRSRRTVGGAVAATRWALEHGIAGQLAGGTHHAHRDRGGGYCVFNDQACAALLLLSESRVRRVLIVDLDVHQGDGTSSILQGHEQVYILSLHGERNYPFRKVASTVDRGLADGTGDEDYLKVLDEELDRALGFRPDLILYQAGVDPLASDRLGKLSLTHAGLRARDRRVIGLARDLNIPISLAMGGGYAEPISDTVRAHVGTYEVVREFWPRLS